MSPDRVAVSWGYGPIPPISVSQSRKGVAVTIPLFPPAIGGAVRRAGSWALCHLSRLTALHGRHTRCPRHQHSDPGTGSRRIGGSDVRDPR
jgi:hypothetical protein